MRKTRFSLVVLLVLASVAFALAQDAPKKPEALALTQIKLLVAQRDLTQERAARLQLEYEKNLKGFQEQYAKQTTDIEAAMRSLFAESKVSPTEFDLDLDKGAFTKKTERQK